MYVVILSWASQCAISHCFPCILSRAPLCAMVVPERKSAPVPPLSESNGLVQLLMVSVHTLMGVTMCKF